MVNPTCIHFMHIEQRIHKNISHEWKVLTLTVLCPQAYPLAGHKQHYYKLQHKSQRQHMYYPLQYFQPLCYLVSVEVSLYQNLS
jgi:hypothetical protein